tara:strand:+ start:115 stop:429 length:315 start_codon:yes stop_codon:yes gene_type:complete
MKLIFTVLAAVIAITTPAFAENPVYVNYKIKIDKDENFEEQLRKNEEFFEQLKGNNLFSNWTKEGQEIPENASEMYKKPALTNDVVEGNQETDYIKCEKGIVTK